MAEFDDFKKAVKGDVKYHPELESVYKAAPEGAVIYVQTARESTQVLNWASTDKKHVTVEVRTDREVPVWRVGNGKTR